MNWLEKFLGTKDKEQKKRMEEVSEYVHTKKNAFSAEMGKIHTQARKVHQKTKEAHEESVRLMEIVDGVTANIAIATGAKRRGLK